MKKSFISLSIYLLAFLTFATAQSYHTAAGVRVGKYFGLTVSQRVLPKLTVEGIYQTRLQGSEQYLTGLVKKHNSLIARRLNFYYGGGVHTAWVDMGAEGGSQNFTGFDGILGLEMTIGRVNVALDYKPAFNPGQNDWMQNQGGVSVRYVLFKSNSPKSRQRQKGRSYKQKNRQKALKYRKRSLKREAKGRGW